MTVVDRSNTNWTPWPRLAAIPQRFQLIGGVAAIMGAAALLLKARTSRAPVPSTINKEWQDATDAASHAKEREAADPIVLNPISKSMKK
ncbi:hypothetical protein BWQ96_08248 [Gracilariopsis chorda]|uniref:Uncharacterized protein n=1 Tax=Gracilariopsis chorda TaxID=448386 RepID=A0A2V3ILP5_9FLOR|nr:hypothetical protein BWQ96_08248 [Gracilariopsis chorda]|eukprot:PXF42040.1 hypothetical protein BWQ96_08248 [Gracilariopsis chorda]